MKVEQEVRRVNEMIVVSHPSDIRLAFMKIQYQVPRKTKGPRANTMTHWIIIVAA